MAEGTLRIAAKRSRLPEYNLTIADGRKHVRAFSGALANFGASVRQAIDRTDALGDKDTVDIFTEISRGVDKYLWFVEAHGQAEGKPLPARSSQWSVGVVGFAQALRIGNIEVLVEVIIMIPAVLAYTAFSYRVFRGKVLAGDVHY